MKLHTYEVQVDWTGNDGEGTKSYRSYRRDHTIRSAGKALIEGSSDLSFCGDGARYNPEELLERWRRAMTAQESLCVWC